LRQVAGEVPDRVALVEGLPTAERRRWTCAELRADAKRCAHWLLQHFKPGEHIAVWAHNLPESPIPLLAPVMATTLPVISASLLVTPWPTTDTSRYSGPSLDVAGCAAPRATGRVGSEHHSDHEPGYSGVSTPMTASAATTTDAVTPEPQ
jgi:hypothetical protein